MNRRDFGRDFGRNFATLSALTSVASLSASLTSIARAQTQPAGPTSATNAAPGLEIGMLVYPGMIALDLVGPQTVFALLPNARIHLLSKDMSPVASDIGLMVQPTRVLRDSPRKLDILFVPGGLKGTINIMNDASMLDDLAALGQGAGHVTSVCTGALVLGAAGLLRGYKATSHWYVRDLLPLMGASLVKERVVEDRNRITAGGVTAGIDFGLYLAGRLYGDAYAKRIQLLLEYDPQPPYQAGSPEGAGAELTGQVLQSRAALIEQARAAAVRLSKFE